MKNELSSFTFRFVQKSDTKMIHNWLRQDYIAEWIHGVGLQSTLDVFICNTKYLGKGLAVPMIKGFLVGQFSSIKKVLIDPE